MAGETAFGKPLEVYVSKTESELLSGEPNVLGLSSDQNTIVFNNKVIGSGAGIRYKTIRLSGSSGWIRFAQHKESAANNVTAIFGIERGYGSKKDEHYVFASSLNHAEQGYITQLSGSYLDNSSHFIKKVRSAQKKGDTKPFYLDFYIESSLVESYYVWILGDWELLDITRVNEEADAANNITRFVEFETTNGFATSGDVKATDFIGNMPDTAVFSKELTAFNSLKSPRLRSLNSQIRNNLLSFNGTALTAEYTIDGGATWVDFGLTDTQKNQFVTDGWEHTNQLKAGNGDTTVAPQLKGVRLTYDFSAIANGTFYGNISDAIITINANNGTVMKVEVLDWVNNVWAEKGTYNLYSPDALPNAVYLGTLRFRRASTTTANQYKAIRFIFSYQDTSTNLESIPFCIRSIKLFSNGVYSNELPNYARYGHLYSTDSLQNMILPNELYPNAHLSKNLGSNTKAFKVAYTRYVYAPSSTALQLGSGATARWQIDTSGHYVPITGNKYNIGSASYPVNNVYANRLVGVADKAAADENNKALTTYVSDITKTASGIQIKKGNGATSDVDISSNILRFQKVLDVEPTYASSGASSWNYITFIKPLNKFVAVNSSTLPPTYHQAFNNGEISQDAYNNNPNVLFIDNITGEPYIWHGDTNETFSKISATKEYTTEVISIDTDFNVTCLSNNAISTLPTNILNGVMYLKSNGAVKSTAIPLNLGTTSNYPIKYLNGTTWVDATILVRASNVTVQWFLTVSSDTPVSTEGLVLEGQITANFVEG